MQAPKEITRPPEGKLKAFSKLNWASSRYGWWYVIDHEGKILTSFNNLFDAAQEANRSKPMIRSKRGYT